MRTRSGGGGGDWGDCDGGGDENVLWVVCDGVLVGELENGHILTGDVEYGWNEKFR